MFPSSPLFLPVSHCFRGWSKINFKVYDIINCLNKDLITHFVWYFGKEKRYDIETLSIDRVFKKKNFYHCMQEIILKIQYFERGLSKSFKKSTLFFLSNPKGARTSDQSLLRLRNKFREIPLLVTYYLTKFDDVI